MLKTICSESHTYQVAWSAIESRLSLSIILTPYTSVLYGRRGGKDAIGYELFVVAFKISSGAIFGIQLVCGSVK